MLVTALENIMTRALLLHGAVEMTDASFGGGGGAFGLISSVNYGTIPLKVKIRENLGSAS